MLKKTPLYEEHAKLKGRFTEFGGWDMPVQYTSIIDEHNAVRTHAGIFDTSHMGEVIVSGPGALGFLNKVTTANIDALQPGQAKYSFFLNEKGGIIDDLIIYKREDDYLLIINAGNVAKDFEWMQKHAAGDVTLDNISPKTSLLALQGPDSEKIMQALVKDDLSAVKYFRHLTPSFNFISPEYALLARTGYTGEDGFEIMIPNEYAAEVWRKLIEAGAKPCGLGCRDTLRLEACMPLHGHEITDETTPLEADLGWAVYWHKDFIGKDALVKQKEQGLPKKLIAFVLEGSGIPRAHCGIAVDGKPAGEVTSGTFSPTLKKGIGLAYSSVPVEPGAKITVTVHNQERPATVVPKPFYKRPR